MKIVNILNINRAPIRQGLSQVYVPLINSVSNRLIVRIVCMAIASCHSRKLIWSSSSSRLDSNIVFNFKNGERCYATFI